MKTLSICTTPESARSAIASISGNDGKHVLVLMQEAVACTEQNIGAGGIKVLVSSEDLKARGCQSAWDSIDAPGLVRMIVDSARVHVL